MRAKGSQQPPANPSDARRADAGRARPFLFRMVCVSGADSDLARDETRTARHTWSAQKTRISHVLTGRTLCLGFRVQGLGFSRKVFFSLPHCFTDNERPQNGRPEQTLRFSGASMAQTQGRHAALKIQVS